MSTALSFAAPVPLPHKLAPPIPPMPPRSAPQSTPRSAVRTYTPLPFLPYLSPNPHFQTILPHFYPPAPPFDYTRRSFPSDDSHALLHVDYAFTPNPPTFDFPIVPPLDQNLLTELESQPHTPKQPPLAVVLHGLESNSHATVTRRIVAALGHSAFQVAALNFRTCASGTDDIPSTLRLYHAGFTEDLQTLLRVVRVDALRKRTLPPDVYLCGFSLGANVVCQYLARRGPRALQLDGVVAAAAACVPFDPESCQRKLDNGWRGYVYSKRMVTTMHSKFRKAVDSGVDIGLCEVDSVLKADRVGKIDDAFISPVFGFRNRLHYYEEVNSATVLNRITVPTYVINARDDPFFDHESGRKFPTANQIGDAPVLLHVTEHGGHCGFLDKEAFQSKGPCYFQREFARFFVHVRDGTPEQDSARGESKLSTQSLPLETGLDTS